MKFFEYIHFSILISGIVKNCKNTRVLKNQVAALYAYAKSSFINQLCISKAFANSLLISYPKSLDKKTITPKKLIPSSKIYSG